MVRVILYLLAIAAVATGLSWLADRPGELIVTWEGYEIQTSVFRAVVMFAVVLALSVLLFSLARQLWQSPAAIGYYFNRRRQRRGLDALSSGMIAIGAGDRTTATRYAIQARKSLPNEPLTHLLRAQAAQLSGDKATARRIFEAMLGSPDTEQLGLRGLFLEAEHEGETEAARQFAERAVRLNPRLAWPVDALFDIQCKQGDWRSALDTLTLARKNGHVDKQLADRRRAVLLTAQAQAAEDSDPERALALAAEAHGLAPDLIPAAAIAGRLLASRGNTPRATRIIQKTWSRSPHPDLAHAYAYSRIGDSPRDRFDRVRQLAALTPNSIESPIAVATAAIEAKDFDAARKALEPLLDGRLTHRVCVLLARIEGEQHGDKGRVREWLARAVNAPRDPTWTADGVVSEHWQPISPVSGLLDAFQWRVPVEQMEKSDADLLARKLDEFVALGAPDVAAVTEELIDAKVVEKPVVPVETKPAIVSDAPQAVARPPAPKAAAKPHPSPAATVAATPPAPQVEAVRLAPAEAKPVSKTGTKPSDYITPETTADAAEVSAQATRPQPPTSAPPPRPEAKAEGVSLPASVATPAPVASAKPAPMSTASAKPAPASAQQAKPVQKIQKETAHAKPGQPKIFVSPHAPDDPGPEAADVDELPKSHLQTVRATTGTP